jgi:hypothetical protein
MFKLMVERGLVDEAARDIHDAGLGSVLKRLAMHVRESEAGTHVKEKRYPVKEAQVLQSEQLASNT